MMSLVPSSIAVLVGDIPAADSLLCLRSAYGDTVFAQVVVLRSANLVQLCNFMKRCRLEQQRNRYLVLLHFLPNRETQRLIDKHAELNLSIVIMGGPCVTRAVRELVPLADYLLEWHEKKTLLRRPVFCVRVVKNTQVGVVNVWPSTVSSSTVDDAQAAQTLAHQLCNTWQGRQWTASSFASWEQPTTRIDTSTHTTPPPADDTPPKSQSSRTRCGTATMNVARACSLLGISEAQSMQPESVRKAFRALARTHHPDKKPLEHRDAAAALFADISEAHTFLTSLFRP